MQKTPDDIIIFLLVSTSIILLMAVFVIVIVFLYRKKQIAYQKSLDTIRLDYEKNILNAQLEIQEQTFQDISREIHDNIGMSLTLAKLNLNTLNLTDTKQSTEQIHSSVDLITKAISDLTDISKSLNAEYIANYGLMNALEQQIAKIRHLGLEVGLEVNGNTVFMDSQKELIIFRIMQEALNNILKHARATKISIELSYDATHLNANISDNGQGFDMNSDAIKNRKSGTGLINMNKRAQMIQGYWIINSSPHNGTIVKLSIPYNE